MSKIRIIKSLNNYSDGSEDLILNILKNATDVSSTSDELREKISDWPTDYHLNRERVGILFPLMLNRNLRVLDVGGGSGIISRYLAEEVSSVTILEGEHVRALAAEERCRDLDNVEIIVGEISDLDTNNEFDLIVVIGVLEYIGLAQANEWLRQINKLLAKDGTLILAIENRLGIKYFMGYPEDHTGNFWEGILNYLEKDKPRTYSKNELGALLNESGFQYQNWWYPFPDYKMPTTILSEEVLDKLNAEEISSLIRRPFQNAGHEVLIEFDHKNLIDSIAKAGILDQLANSFLVVAGKDSKSNNFQEDALIIKVDENERKKDFRRVSFLKGNNKFLNWERRIIGDLEISHNHYYIDHKVVQTPWIPGDNLFYELSKKTSNLKSELELIIKLQLVDIVKKMKLNDEEVEVNPYLPKTECLSQYVDNFDIGLENFIVFEDEMTFIDTEWGSKRGVCQELAILRAIFWLLSNNKQFWSNLNLNNDLLWDCSAEIARSVLGKLHHTLEDFIEAESWFLGQVNIHDQSYYHSALKLRANLGNKDFKKPDEKLPLSDYAINKINNTKN
jgi:2-polyprenyl-3-methyl-5-hydroxy-6-metoxy-1,4-benzoquinol methylase